jgi:hypothetical protein
VLGLGRCSLLHRIVRSVNCVFAVLLSEGHPGVADGPRLGVFQKLLQSGIIYGIPDNRFRIVVDELMHLRND